MIFFARRHQLRGGIHSRRRLATGRRLRRVFAENSSRRFQARLQAARSPPEALHREARRAIRSAQKLLRAVPAALAACVRLPCALLNAERYSTRPTDREVCGKRRSTPSCASERGRALLPARLQNYQVQLPAHLQEFLLERGHLDPKLARQLENSEVIHGL